MHAWCIMVPLTSIYMITKCSAVQSVDDHFDCSVHCVLSTDSSLLTWLGGNLQGNRSLKDVNCSKLQTAATAQTTPLVQSCSLKVLHPGSYSAFIIVFINSIHIFSLSGGVCHPSGHKVWVQMLTMMVESGVHWYSACTITSVWAGRLSGLHTQAVHTHTSWCRWCM